MLDIFLCVSINSFQRISYGTDFFSVNICLHIGTLRQKLLFQFSMHLNKTRLILSQSSEDVQEVFYTCIPQGILKIWLFQCKLTLWSLCCKLFFKFSVQWNKTWHILSVKNFRCVKYIFLMHFSRHARVIYSN